MSELFAAQAWLPDGWARDVLITHDERGTITGVAVGTRAGGAEVAQGPVVPGMPNLHSHAFQRAIAGLTEHAGLGSEDSFWTWRDVMYRFVAQLSPDDLEAIAGQLYVEMVKAGYTAVGEFHYLHHAPDGAPYADPAEMANRIVAAAQRVGLGLSLLPVAYLAGGFDGRPPDTEQCRFVSSPRAFLDLVGTLYQRVGSDPQVRIGAAPHSLRAVSPSALSELIAGLHAIDRDLPIHIHVAEQVREVEDCLASYGRRPVELLLDAAPVDDRWCLVHATHVNDSEIAGIVKSGATVGLCPTTEANLGDGLFPLKAFLDGGGRIGIGSDSHISVSPVEELRWLEYGQRLIRRERNVTATGDAPSTGARLYRAALVGGAQALSRPIAAVAVGKRADLVVLDTTHPVLAAREADDLVDSWIFSGNANAIRDVMVGGAWVVRDGRHAEEEAIADTYRRTVAGLAFG